MRESLGRGCKALAQGRSVSSRVEASGERLRTMPGPAPAGMAGGGEAGGAESLHELNEMVRRVMTRHGPTQDRRARHRPSPWSSSRPPQLTGSDD